MKTIYTTVLLAPETMRSECVRRGIQEAMDEPKVNEWHKALHPGNLVGVGQLVEEWYTRDYRAYATMGGDIPVPNELHTRILEAIDSTVNMDCEGPYKQVDIGGYIVDILWWHLEDE